MSDFHVETVGDFQVKAISDFHVKCIGISELAPYPKYKDSDIEWISEIPEGWKVKKLKHLTKQIVDGTHFTPTYVSEGVPFLRVTDIQNKEIELKSVKRIPKKEHIELTKRCKPEKGDLLLSKNGTIGVPCVVTWDWEFSIFVSLCLIKFKQEMNVNYSKYFLLSDQIDEQITMGGKKNTITNLHLDKIKEFLFIVPPLPEQQAIVDFLDRETSRIDMLIEKKQHFIELLEEKRSALISHAVTKGLDPDVPLKNSGIEWIGEIPNDWLILKVKYATYVKGRVGWHGLRSDEFINEGPFLLTGTDFVNGRINWESCYHVSKERYNQDPYIQLKENDLLITKDGTIGKIALVKGLKSEATLNSGIFVTRPISENYINEFMYWVLNSDIFSGFFEYMSNGTTIQHLYQNTFSNFSFPVPLLPEQRAIASYLDHETTQIDILIEKIKQSIEYLKEYRTALISDAVTGKIDVRRTACE